MKLAWVAAGILALLVALVAILYGGKAVEPRESPTAAVRDSGSLEQALRDLDQRLARIESSLAVQGARGVREAQPSASAEPPAEAPRSADDLRADLRQLTQRVEGLAATLADSRKVTFSVPTLEQIHRARRDVDWRFIDDLRQLCKSDPEAALARVRLMTFDDLLQKVGVPTGIRYTDDGGWWYSHPDDKQGNWWVLFHFVGDTVCKLQTD